MFALTHSRLAVLLLASGTALAQAPASPAPQGRPDSRIEHIRTEDQGARIDELRVGGQTQSISVTPKSSALPSYQIQPSEGARTPPTQREGAESGNGARVWNIFKF